MLLHPFHLSENKNNHIINIDISIIVGEKDAGRLVSLVHSVLGCCFSRFFCHRRIFYVPKVFKKDAKRGWKV